MNKHEAIIATHPNVVTIRGDDAFDDNGNSNSAATFMIFDKKLVEASSDWFDSDPNFYIFVSIFLLLCCLLSLFFQNFIYFFPC